MNQKNNIAQLIASDPNKTRALGITVREKSFAPKSGTKNMLEERSKAIRLSWNIVNRDTSDYKIIIFPISSDDPSGDYQQNNTMFGEQAEVLNETSGLGSAVFLEDGPVVANPANLPATFENCFLGAKSLNASRKINQLIRFAGNSPMRITEMKLKSKVIATGEKDSSNYDNVFETIFFSPFEDPIRRELPLRVLQEGASNFNPDMLDIDFQKLAFPVIFSNEHAFVFQVNAGTSLTMTLAFGAHDSRAQKHWRDVKQADDTLAEVGLLRRM
ncbi:MAG: hypothetical protein HYU67_04615 [Flavobacteriia bacterium]|nr:hypothetical protein [Flavobacteriia bacterium]